PAGEGVVQNAGCANASASNTSTPMRNASSSKYCSFFASTRRGSPGSRNISELKRCLFGLSEDSRCSQSGKPMASTPSKNAGASKLMASASPPPEQQVAAQRVVERLRDIDELVIRPGAHGRFLQRFDVRADPLAIQRA